MAPLFDYWPLMAYAAFIAVYVFGLLYVLYDAPYIFLDIFNGLRAFAAWYGETAESFKASMRYLLSAIGERA